MLKTSLAPLCATLLLLQPALTLAQVTSYNGRTGAVVAVTGDNTCAQVTNCPSTNATNTFGAYQVINASPLGTVSPRNNVGLQIIGPAPNASENNVVDAFAYGSPAQYDAERYDWNGTSFQPVKKGENIGGYWGEAFTGAGGGDPADAGYIFIATEDQTPTHNGVSASIWYTPNGSTGLKEGFGVSTGGNGGGTVGGTNVVGSEPPDLGNGTIDAADSIVTQNHFRTTGGHGAISACGTSPIFVAGTDQAGVITTGGLVSACTYTFAKTYGAAPICMVEIQHAATPGVFISGDHATNITVSFVAPFSGSFQYMCIGVG